MTAAPIAHGGGNGRRGRTMMNISECLACARTVDLDADDYCPVCGALLPESDADYARRMAAQADAAAARERAVVQQGDEGGEPGTW